jgi:hypothetical protein
MHNRNVWPGKDEQTTHRYFEKHKRFDGRWDEASRGLAMLEYFRSTLIGSGP